MLTNLQKFEPIDLLLYIKSSVHLPVCLCNLTANHHAFIAKRKQIEVHLPSNVYLCILGLAVHTSSPFTAMACAKLLLPGTHDISAVVGVTLHVFTSVGFICASEIQSKSAYNNVP